MDIQTDTRDSLKIYDTRFFGTGHGFLLARDRDGMFIVWQLTLTPFGPDLYHGRGFYSRDEAGRDFSRRADDYAYLYGAVPGPLYRYYSTQRPVDIGTYPKPPGNQPLIIVNYDCDRRRPVAGGKLSAWGELTYPRPLTESQMADYELTATPTR